MAPADLLQFALAVVIVAFGIASIAGHALRPPPKDRLLLWTGVFALVYGVRMFTRGAPMMALRVDPLHASYAENALNYWIQIPALLFIGELYGRGWRGGLRLLVAAATGYALVAVAVNILTRDPSRMPDPAFPILAAAAIFVFGAGAIAGYRPPRFPEWRILLGGLGVFVLFVIHEHAVSAGLLPTPHNLEPVGYLISVMCLGYIAVTRFFANARQIVANDREMQSAREIQSSILPRQLPSVGGLEIAARYVPLAAVAGDFYDVLRVDDERVSVLVADVSGHGVPAALIASMVKVAFVSESARTSDPAAILHGMNATLCGLFDRAYVTAVCGLFDVGRRTLTYAAAGHPPPLAASREAGSIARLEERGMFLGMFPGAAYAAARVDLEPSSRVVFYTDGVTEAPQGDDLFGIDRLADVVAENRSSAPAGFVDALLRRLEAFAGQAVLPHDDVTVVVVDVP